jgi:hypothetical protein
MKMATPMWSKGAHAADRRRQPRGRLETSGQVMAHAKLRTEDHADPALFAGSVRQARELTLDGSQRRR